MTKQDAPKMENKHVFQYYIGVLLLLLNYSTCDAQNWVDMGTKADNGAPMYWASCDLVINNKTEWGLAKSDTLIGAGTTWSFGYDSGSLVDIAGNESYDCATKSLGNPHRMPSQREFERLISNCDVSFYSIKVKDGYVIPFEPDIRDMSWLWGTWRATNYDGGVLTIVIRSNNTIAVRSFRPGVDALPLERYNGPCTIYMNKIVLDNLSGAYISMDLTERRLYTSNGRECRSDHFVQRGPKQVPAKWIDYMQLKSRINENTLVFPLVKYSSDDDYNERATVSPYLSSHSQYFGWWTSTSANVGNKYYMEVNVNGVQINDASGSRSYRIRPVYDEGHKNPSKYPNDFGWIQLNVGRFVEGDLDIYLDDTLIGRAPCDKEMKVRCGLHQIRITGSRIEDIQRDINVGYHQTCTYYPTITSKYANITIRSAECDIQIDGNTVGLNSWSGELETGSYKVKVIKDCYEPYEETIYVVGGKNETFDITPNRLKAHILDISCNVDNCVVNIDGKTMNYSIGKPLSIDLEMKTTHTMSFEASGFVPISVTFFILEDQVVFQCQKGLDSYDGMQSTVIESGLDGLTIHLSKLNKRLYCGNDIRYKQRPNYNGRLMGVDFIRINGMSLGTETAWCNEYYWKSRVMFSWSLGFALNPGNDEGSLLCTMTGLNVGWQIFRGAGLRVTPQVGVMGCSLFDDPFVALCAKVNVSYPLTDRFVIGAAPMMKFLIIEELDNPYVYSNTCFGVSLTLGWQKRK